MISYSTYYGYHKFYGTFKDVNDETITVDIYTRNLSEDVQIKFGADPMHISYSQPNPHAGAVGQTMSLQIITTRTLMELYSEDALNTLFSVSRGNTLIFTGFASRAEYDQDYLPGIEHEVTIEALDAINVAPSLPYTHAADQQRTLLTLATLARKYAEAVGITTIRDYARLSNKFSEDAFLPYHHDTTCEDDDWMSWGDVLAGVFQSFGCILSVSSDNELTIFKYNGNMRYCNLITYSSYWTTTTVTDTADQYYWGYTAPLYNRTFLRGGRLTVRPSYGRAEFAVARQDPRPLWPDFAEEGRYTLPQVESGSSIVSASWECVSDDGRKKYVVYQFVEQTEDITTPQISKDWLGVFCRVREYDLNSDTSGWELAKEYIAMGPGQHVLRNQAKHPVAGLLADRSGAIAIHVKGLTPYHDYWSPYQYDCMDIMVDSTHSTPIVYAAGPTNSILFIQLGKTEGIISPVITVPDNCCFITLDLLMPDDDYGNKYYEDLPTSTAFISNLNLDRFSYSPLIGRAAGSLIPGNSSSGDGIGPLTDWLNHPHREFTVSALGDYTRFTPYRTLDYNNRDCALVGLDWDVRQRIAQLQLQEIDWIFEPVQETWWIESVGTVTATAGNVDSSGYISVDPSGQTFLLSIRATVHLRSSLGNTRDFTGRISDVMATYGVTFTWAAGPLEHLTGGGEPIADLPDVTILQTSTGNYEGTITFGEWTGIDSHIVGVNLDISWTYYVNGAPHTGEDNPYVGMFKQYPIEEY